MRAYTELVIVIDQSGSMETIRNDIIGGFNALLDEQKKIGECKVSIVLFSDKITRINKRVDINNIERLNERNYVPNGCTALLDAVGNAISVTKNNIYSLKEEDKPKNVIFSILTDGYENASREYSYKQIKKMIELQKEEGWQFMFQGANIDVMEQADKLGIDKDMAIEFEANSCDVKRKISKVSGLMKSIIVK